MSSFKALYGQEFLAPLKCTNPMIKVQASKEMLDEMQQQTNLIKETKSLHKLSLIRKGIQ